MYFTPTYPFFLMLKELIYHEFITWNKIKSYSHILTMTVIFAESCFDMEYIIGRLNSIFSPVLHPYLSSRGATIKDEFVGEWYFLMFKLKEDWYITLHQDWFSGPAIRW